MPRLLIEESLQTVLARELEDWRSRETALTLNIERDTAQRDKLREKIKAAEAILGPSTETQRSARGYLPNEILSIMADGRARLPDEIRQMLLARGYPPDKLKTTAGYFYTTLARLLHKKQLKKTSEGKYEKF